MPKRTRWIVLHHYVRSKLLRMTQRIDDAATRTRYLIVLHADRSLRCHHCGHTEQEPETCPVCGSTELARSPAGCQAFVHGRSLGLQFHPEATATVVRRWCAGMRDALAAAGTDADAFVAECERRAPEARVRAALVVETFLSGALVG